jgi:UDP-N-acetyl-D-glucosamine dehydrogenase
MDALNLHKKCVNGSKFLIIGVAYKKNVGDTRESPAIDVIGMLEELGGEIEYFDPYVPELRVDGGINYRSSEMTDSLLENADCVVIITDHSCIDYQEVVDRSHLVVDTRNATKWVKSGWDKIVRI